MIVYACIEIHQEGCVKWIIVMGLRVLLITHFLIWEILVKAVLDVYLRGKNKKFLNLDVVIMHLLQKKVHEKNNCIGLHTENHMFLKRPWCKGWLGQLLIQAICMEL